MTINAFHYDYPPFHWDNPTALQTVNKNTICMIGDSVTTHDHFTAAPNKQITSRSVFGWLNYLLGQRLKPLNIDADTYSGNQLAGVSGNTTTLALARWETCIGPHSPGYIWIRLGYNDVINGVSASTMISNFEQLIAKARAKSAICLISQIMPGSGINTAAEANVWNQVNQWIRATAQLSNDVIYIPQGMSYADGTGTYPVPTAGYTDGIHQYTHSAYMLALEAYNVLNNIIPVCEPPWFIAYDANQSDGAGVWENPMMTGTGGTNGTGSSGSVADGLTAQVGGGGAVVCSKVARTDIIGASWQQMAFTCDAAFTDMTTDYAQLGSTSGVALANLSDGDLIQFFVEFEMDASPTDFGSVWIRIQWGTPNTSYYSTSLEVDTSTANGTPHNKQLQSGVLATVPMAIPTGSTTAFPIIRLAAGAANATFTCRIGRVSVVKVGSATGI